MFINDDMLQKAHKKASSIAYILMSLPIIFALGVELFITGGPEATPPSFYPFLEVVLIFVTCVQIILIVVLRNRIIAGGDGEEVEPDKSDSEKQSFVAQRLFKSFVVSYAFCSSIAVYGLLLFIFGKDGSLLYGFLFSALMLMILQFPKYKDWQSYLKDFIPDPITES